jgi:hypothetical protein
MKLIDSFFNDPFRVFPGGNFNLSGLNTGFGADSALAGIDQSLSGNLDLLGMVNMGGYLPMSKSGQGQNPLREMLDISNLVPGMISNGDSSETSDTSNTLLDDSIFSRWTTPSSLLLSDNWDTDAPDGEDTETPAQNPTNTDTTAPPAAEPAAQEPAPAPAPAPAPEPAPAPTPPANPEVIEDNAEQSDYSVDGEGRNVEFQKDKGANTFNVGGKNNKVAIKNIGKDDTVKLDGDRSKWQEVDKGQDGDDHYIVMKNTETNTEVRIYSDEKDRGHDWIRQRIQ